MDKIVGGYMTAKKSKWNPDKVEAERIEEALVGDKWVKRAKAEAQIDIHSDAALTFCPDEDKKVLKKHIVGILNVMKPRSTTGLDGEDLVRVENNNADRMRASKALIECLQAVDETNEVTHVYKHFPAIIAGYDDGKDEAEVKELQEELEMVEDDLKELDTKIAQAKAVQNSKKERHYSSRRPDMVKTLEKIKAKIAALTERIQRKARATSPTRKRSRDDDGSTSESPEKKMRTAKKFPANSPTDVRHELKDYFQKTASSLMFKMGDDGFEQDGGNWDVDAERKLEFLQEEVTA
jgi:hypothetical protein